MQSLLHHRSELLLGDHKIGVGVVRVRVGGERPLSLSLSHARGSEDGVVDRTSFSGK
jgi:hypothetical protein